jgi:hypothetical protein
LVVIQPLRVIIGSAKYQDIAVQIIITDPPPAFTIGTRHSGLQVSLGLLHTSTRPVVWNNTKDNSFDHMYFQSSDIHVL